MNFQNSLMMVLANGFPPQLTLPDGSKLPALADGEYDAIILGTGLKECIISGMIIRSFYFRSQIHSFLRRNLVG